MLTVTATRTPWPARIAAIAVLAAAVLATLIASPAQAAKAPKRFFGVVPQTDLSAQDFDRMGQAKVGSMRIPIFWSSVDPTAADDFNWTYYDAIFGQAAENGVEVLPFLYGTPDYVSQGLDNNNCSGGECGAFAPKSPAALQAWSDFVKAAVARYGAGGDFWQENPGVPQVPVTVWQLGNEQNSNHFFAPKANPKAYAKVLSAGADAVRSTDGGAKVILGGMAELAGSSKATPGAKYLTKLYKVRGVKSDFDGVALHPYGSKVEKVAKQVESFREVMKKAKDKRTNLYVTELGWSSENGGNPLNRGPKGQADRLKESFKYFLKQRRKSKIATVQWFSWADSANSICDWCANSGLVTQNLEAKPALKAFTKFTGGS